MSAHATCDWVTRGRSIVQTALQGTSGLLGVWPRTESPCTLLGASSTHLAERRDAAPQVVSQGKDLEDYDPADIAMALCRMVSYNIGHLAYLNAKRYGLPRVFFGGFFIRGHPYTMETISFAIRFWSKARPRRASPALFCDRRAS